MLRSFSLTTTAALLCFAAQSVSALTVHHAAITPLDKRADDDNAWTKDYGFMADSHQTTLNYKDTLQAYMGFGAQIYGLYRPERTAAETDESYFIPGAALDGSQDPDGTAQMIQLCLDAVRVSAKAAVESCEQTDCSDRYNALAIWGTWDGMDWAKDGLMLFHCGLVKKDKATCDGDPGISYPTPSCQLSMVQDMSQDMWSAHPEANVVVIGEGQTSIDPITSELSTYAQANGLDWSLPSTSVSRRSIKHHRKSYQGASC